MNNHLSIQKKNLFTFRNISVLILKLILSIFFMWYAFQKVDFSKVNFSALSGTPILIAIILAGVQILINTSRWKYLIEKVTNKSMPYNRVFSIYYFSCFLNQITPSLASDFLRVISSRQLNASLINITESVLMERIISLITLLILSLITFPWLLTAAPSIGIPLQYILILTFACLLGSYFIVYTIKRNTSIWGYFPETLKIFIDNLNWLFYSKCSLKVLLPISLLVHLISSIMLYLVATSIRAHISLYEILQICPIMLLAQILPLSFGGWGTREAAAVILMGSFGVSPSVSITISILFGLILIIVSIPGPIIWLYRQKITSSIT